MSPTLVREWPTPKGPVRIAMAENRRAGTARCREHQQFVADHSRELAAAAFEGYSRHGAGAVVLWRETSPRRFRPRPFEPERLFYSTQLHVLPGATEATFDGWEAEQIEVYDPQSESIVLFIEGSIFTAYRVSGPTAPPDALVGARARWN